MLVQNNRADQYSQDIMLAKECLEAQDYDGAIAAYNHAISLDKTKSTAYEGLVRIYLSQGDTGNIERILRYFEENSNQDQSLRNKYSEEIEAVLNIITEQNAEVEEEGIAVEAMVQQETEQVGLESGILAFISGASYSDYLNLYGTATVEKDGNVSVLSYVSVPLVCTYGVDNGQVLVDTNGQPFSESKPTSVMVSDLSVLLIGMTGETSFDVLKQDASLKNAQIVSKNGKAYVQFEAEDCTVLIEADEQGTISGPNAWNQITFNETEEQEETGTLELTGVVIDAVSGTGLSDATIKIRAGLNNESGATVVELKSSRAGTYLSEVEPGDYTVEVSAPGYITEFYGVTVYSWITSTEKDFVLSPETADGEIRIVLEWNSFPNDLDSYLFGTSSSGAPVKVYFGNPYMDGVAELDTDCMHGYGPETITIYDIGGNYDFVVADFNVTGRMGQSGATVKVYMPGADKPEIISVPSDVEDAWAVCSINNGVLSVENRPYTGGSQTGWK